MNSISAPAAALAAARSVAPAAASSSDAGVALLAAAKLLLADLERGRVIDAHVLRTAMIVAFGGSDAEAAWDWKTAYDACDAAHIHDHLDAAVRPTVVLMNPPFSVAAHVEGRVADAALRHVSSALMRLAVGGRLVAITGASLSPDNPSWRDSLVRLQERGRVVVSAAVDGRVFDRHGTSVETRLTVIDRVPAANPTAFPDSPGTASDTATLLDWVIRLVPARATVIMPPTFVGRPAPIAAKSVTARLPSNTGSPRKSASAIVGPTA